MFILTKDYSFQGKLLQVDLYLRYSIRIGLFAMKVQMLILTIANILLVALQGNEIVGRLFLEVI